MTRGRRAAVLAGLALCGCATRNAGPDAGAASRYVVGEAYQSGNAWFYPREDFQLDATGLAYVSGGVGGLTANGERLDPDAMAASHATLQLPAVARVTNLETGVQAYVRINDRGPGRNRLLGLSPRAAERLGVGPGSVARVRLQVDAERSQALRDALGGSGPAQVATAPREAVAAETLAPLPGTSSASRVRVASTASNAMASDAPRPAPDVLPSGVMQGAPAPGQLWLRAGEFGQPGPARVVQGRLGGLGAVIERVGRGRAETYRLRAGPYATVAEADAALDQAARAGVTDAVIVVE